MVYGFTLGCKEVTNPTLVIDKEGAQFKCTCTMTVLGTIVSAFQLGLIDGHLGLETS